MEVRSTLMPCTAKALRCAPFGTEPAICHLHDPQVAFWELAPYFPNITVNDLGEDFMREFIRENAGKAFEFMVDKVRPDAPPLTQQACRVRRQP